MKTRQTIVKKPKFLLYYLVSLIILLAAFSTVGLYVYYSEYHTYEMEVQEQGIHSEENLLTTIRFITNKEELSSIDIPQLKNLLIKEYALTGQRYKMTINDLEEIDSNKTAILVYYLNGNDERFLQLADEKYLEPFNDPEVVRRGFYNKNDLYDHYQKSPIISFECREFYADFDKGLFIPVEVEIYEHDQNGIGTLSGKILTFNPDDTEGLTHIVCETDGSAPYILSYGTVAGYDGIDNEEEYTYSHRFSTFFYHKIDYVSTSLHGIPFADVYRVQINTGIVLIVLAAIAFAFIPSTIIYNSNKRKYEISEYRRKMINAMAHDLKTPLAAITGYAENLSYHIGTDKQEYYARKIGDKAAQMTGMINNILDFSKSEELSANIKKESFDIDSVITEVIADNDHMVKARSLKINYEQNAVTVNTDKELFKQAVANLIGNAVQHSKEGTIVDISCNNTSVVIINTVDKKVDDIKNIRKPFVKGIESRGNNGNGLGLAIADNNLAMLRYKLELKTEGNKFYAIINLQNSL